MNWAYFLCAIRLASVILLLYLCVGLSFGVLDCLANAMRNLSIITSRWLSTDIDMVLLAASCPASAFSESNAAAPSSRSLNSTRNRKTQIILTPYLLEKNNRTILLLVASKCLSHGTELNRSLSKYWHLKLIHWSDNEKVFKIQKSSRSKFSKLVMSKRELDSDEDFLSGRAWRHFLWFIALGAHMCYT